MFRAYANVLAARDAKVHSAVSARKPVSFLSLLFKRMY
jgi:hypothetical protein